MSIAVLLLVSTLFAGVAAFSRSPIRMVLGWVGLGLSLSAGFLALGFEFLAVMNAIFVVGSAIALQLFSALFGTKDSYDSERSVKRRHWIEGIGSSLTLGGILGFALSETTPSDRLHEDFSAGRLAETLIGRFPELPWILALSLFLVIIGVATIGRPAWKRVREERR
jgi:NADH:ubiquinone oxidoreductase subunit 6 (subunit J)